MDDAAGRALDWESGFAGKLPDGPPSKKGVWVWWKGGRREVFWDGVGWVEVVPVGREQEAGLGLGSYAKPLPKVVQVRGDPLRLWCLTQG